MRKKPAQKIFGHGRDSNPSFCLADLKKILIEIYAQLALVWQLAYKAYKICHFVGLRKRKV